MDLLSTVMHELGHVLGLEHVDGDEHAHDLMGDTLDPGVRYILHHDDDLLSDGLAQAVDSASAGGTAEAEALTAGAGEDGSTHFVGWYAASGRVGSVGSSNNRDSYSLLGGLANDEDGEGNGRYRGIDSLTKKPITSSAVSKPWLLSFLFDLAKSKESKDPNHDLVVSLKD